MIVASHENKKIYIGKIYDYIACILFSKKLWEYKLFKCILCPQTRYLTKIRISAGIMTVISHNARVCGLTSTEIFVDIMERQQR